VLAVKVVEHESAGMAAAMAACLATQTLGGKRPLKGTKFGRFDTKCLKGSTSFTCAAFVNPSLHVCVLFQ
jgi:hypothetical protein